MSLVNYNFTSPHDVAKALVDKIEETKGAQIDEVIADNLPEFCIKFSNGQSFVVTVEEFKQ
jgi:hypothetical protein